jgi:hypothetical protein
MFGVHSLISITVKSSADPKTLTLGQSVEQRHDGAGANQGYFDELLRNAGAQFAWLTGYSQNGRRGSAENGDNEGGNQDQVERLHGWLRLFAGAIVVRLGSTWINLPDLSAPCGIPGAPAITYQLGII